MCCSKTIVIVIILLEFWFQIDSLIKGLKESPAN